MRLRHITVPYYWPLYIKNNWLIPDAISGWHELCCSEVLLDLFCIINCLLKSSFCSKSIFPRWSVWEQVVREEGAGDGVFQQGDPTMFQAAPSLWSGGSLGREAPPLQLGVVLLMGKDTQSSLYGNVMMENLCLIKVTVRWLLTLCPLCVSLKYH